MMRNDACPFLPINCVIPTTRTIGSVSKFPRKSDAWAEVQRLRGVGVSGRLTVAALIESYEKTELPQKARSTQEQHRLILHDYIRPRWGTTYVDEVRVLELKQWFMAIHSLATVLITEEQVDPKTAQGILRHANSDVTMEIYTHAQDQAKRKALEKFEARLVQ